MKVSRDCFCSAAPHGDCWPDCGSPQRGKVLTRDELTAALAGIGVQAALDEPLPPAKHVFTHKIWELGGWRGTAPACALPDGYVWAAPEDLAEVYPVPNAFGAYVKAK